MNLVPFNIACTLDCALLKNIMTLPKTDHSYRNLLTALLIMISSYPIMITGGILGRLFELLLTVSILSTASIVSLGKTRQATITILAGVVVSSLTVFEYVHPMQKWLTQIRYALILLYYLMICWNLSLDVFVGKRISKTNRLYGAICIYLLVGLSFGYLYISLNLLVPDSFGCQTSLCHDDFEHRFEMGLQHYYSFTTLATVGYGDISPMTPVAGMLSNLEAVFGQMYVAIVVARLVWIHLMDESTHQK